MPSADAGFAFFSAATAAAIAAEEVAAEPQPVATTQLWAETKATQLQWLEEQFGASGGGSVATPAGHVIVAFRIHVARGEESLVASITFRCAEAATVARR